MTVYLDVIWFLNVCIDLLLLYLTATVLKRSISKWRLLISSLFASSIVFLLFTPLSFLFYQPWMKILFSMSIVLMAFGFKRLSYFLENLFMFYFVTFAIGGGMFAIHYFLQSDAAILNGLVITTSTGFGSPISWLFVLIAFPCVWYFSKRRVTAIKVKKVRYDQLTEVEITIGDIFIETRGLIDSGNQLQDPISKAPVMILDMTKLSGYFPASFIENIAQVDQLGNQTMDEESQELEHRMRIIPYRGVGQQNQFLMALKPDYVKVKEKGEEHLIKKVLLGLNHTPLSSEDEYQCILHPKMMISDQGKKLA
ncbi:sigma-E processing peptidase SpoIIGA [Desertibacillus haloalkaliphilus]|uniref:sigma-E processing peptidase SpoIIGA n=1 Tax=Desertibacillus haloalkaliphilus TaxID=1328930 RepID=UPI001C25744B|nr:sigma-E processing peptidase SpoIIGA [Desertibacillus haloalkaliphilus]MBU8907101.1 sigma-E processing peptidase SpoIIGA [Desertibacillus haloalkaliphilus]